MQEHHNAPASILSEADIRTTALDGANLVPRSECHVEECADALFRSVISLLKNSSISIGISCLNITETISSDLITSLTIYCTPSTIPT